jgi:tetratricopeptide (TPR) repeat protein
MKLLDMLLMLSERSLEKRARKYGKGCARIMLFSFSAMKERYKGEAPTYAWIARKALNTRPDWRQVDETTFIYEMGPKNDQPMDVAEYCDEPWLTGTLEITDVMSLWDVIQGVIRIELYWYYLRNVEIWNRLHLMELAVSEAAKYIGPTNAFEVLQSRSAWKKLPSDFLNALANKLNSVEKAIEFAELCETTRILENNIHLGSNPDFAIGAVAQTLTSYASMMSKQRQFDQAKRVLELTLLLKPRHLSAWTSMALVTFSMGDCGAAVSWADKVLAFKPDPNSTDSWERGFAEAITPEGEQEAAKVFGEPEMIGAWKSVQEEMKAIKDTCHR